MPTLFTRLIRRELPAEIVAEAPAWVALLDINPVHPGHILLIPRHEARYLAELPGEALAALGPFLAAAIAAVKGATGAPAVNVLVNDGPEAGQAVPHVHLHVIPRFAEDGSFAHPAGRADPAPAATAAKLRAAWR